MKHTIILAGDDEESVLRLLGDSLLLEEWELARAEDVPQAVEKSKAGKTDLILMLLDSRAREGWETIEVIGETNPLLPVIVIAKEPGLRDMAEAAGARALVERPVDITALLQSMRELLAEPMERRLSRARASDLDFRHVPASDAGFRAMLYQRYTIPYAMAAPFRHWGINE